MQMSLHSIVSTLSGLAPVIGIVGCIFAAIAILLPVVEVKLRPRETVLIARVGEPPDPNAPISLDGLKWTKYNWEWGRETMLFDLPEPPQKLWYVFYAQKIGSLPVTEIEPLSSLPGLASELGVNRTIHGQAHRLWHFEDHSTFKKIRVSR